MVNKKTFLFFSILSSLVLVTCEGVLPPRESKDTPYPARIRFDTESFYQEWAAWEAQGITNYSVKEDLELSHIRSETAHIVVRDNAIIQKKTLDRWDKYNVEDNYYYKYGFLNEVRTISEIYAWVNRVYEETAAQYTGINVFYSIQILIIYNEEFHYPKWVYMSGWSGELECDLHLSEFIPASMP
jgi:hypothetical protein